MASILFCWELGAGFGHLTPHRAALAMLRQRGHSVHVAVRDLVRASKAFEGLPFHYWQAPTPQSRPEMAYINTHNFAHILHNTGLGDSLGVAARMSAWKNIIAVTRPNVVLVDYCPTALLALRGLNIPTVVTGTGFFIPPNVSPCPVFPMVVNETTPEKIAREEQQLLDAINTAVARHNQPPLTSLAQLFHEVSATIFRSLPEFDHYPGRSSEGFLGLPPDPVREPINWPEGEGPRVFAYLKPFQTLDVLLTELQNRKLPTIIACDGIQKPTRQKFASPLMRFVPPTVDIAQMGRESQFAITNANLTTSVRLLLQGCPLITIPLQLEQMLVAANFQRLGTGIPLLPTVAEDIPRQLTEILTNPKYREAANVLAVKYRNLPDNYTEQSVAVLDRFLAATGAQSA